MTLFIGDVHGKYGRYKTILKGQYKTIQVGDMGVGFRKSSGVRAGQIVNNPPHYAMIRGDHRFIRGNHDNPGECKNHSQWIPDGTVEGDTMFVGGGLSVDRAYRQLGYSYWLDEELSYEEFQAIHTVYDYAKPRRMVTHDCPEEVAREMARVSGRNKLDFPSSTRDELQKMWQRHAPEVWVFGHWHTSFDHVLNGTRFVCLAELEVKEIE